MSEVGILSYGLYLPRRRLQRNVVFAANRWFAPGLGQLAKGERAIANWDEDAITMGLEAARACLGDLNRGDVEGVTLASVTLPFADRLNAGVVKEALNLRNEVAASDVGGSMRAATTALCGALERSRTCLCIGSDLRKSRPASEGELLQGDGAAAILVGTGTPIAKLIASHSVTIDFVDHFRSTGEDFDYHWEARWVRDEGHLRILADAVTGLAEKAGITAHAIEHVALPIASGGAVKAIARKLGLDDEALIDGLGAKDGDIGTGQPLLMLAQALERAKPGERILVAGFGQGADVLLFEATAAIADFRPYRRLPDIIGDGVADENYHRFLFHRGLLDLERGIRAELDQKQPGTTLYRKRTAVLGLMGSRCKKTGTVQFPKSKVSVDPNSRAMDTQEDYPLADRVARIVSYTADALGYSPDPPTFYGTLDFDGGGRIITEFADVIADEVEIGRPMRMVFRIKATDEQRHFTKYFWKAVPIAKGEA